MSTLPPLGRDRLGGGRPVPHRIVLTEARRAFDEDLCKASYKDTYIRAFSLAWPYIEDRRDHKNDDRLCDRSAERPDQGPCRLVYGIDQETDRVSYCDTIHTMRIAHRGLRRFHERSDAKGLNADWLPRIRQVLTVLAQASEPRDLDIPGFRLHPLKGDRRGEWGVTVSGNWRIVFRFEDGQAVGVNLEDYH